MSEQQQINYGSQPNDGQGDPLRTAFIKTDDNFSNIWAAGPVGSNITISDTTVTVDTVNGNLVLNPNGIGNVVVNRTVLPNFDNTHNLGSPGSRFRSAFVGSGGVIASGNITAPYFIGDGSQLTGIGSNYGNANVVTLLADLGSNSVSTTGNVTAGYVLGNGSQLTGLPSGYGNSDVAAYLPSYTGNLSGGNLTINSSGNVWAVAGRQITGPGGTYWFTNPAQSLAIFSGGPGENLRIQSQDANSVTQTRVTLTDTYAEVFVENGVNHAWRFQESGSFDAAGSIVPVVSLATTEYTLGNAASPWTGVYSTGNSFLGNIEVTGDIIPSANVTYSLGNATNYWSNLWVANNTIYIGGVPLGITGNTLTVNGEALLSNDSNTSITTTGNITADYFIGDGSQLTNLPFDASQIENGTSNVAIATANGNVTVTADSTQTWTFGTSGNLRFPDGTTYTGSELVSATVPTVGGTASAGEAGITYLSGGLSKWAIFTEGAFTVGVWTDVQVGWTVTDNNGFTDIIAGRGSFGAASFQTTVNSWPAPASGKTYVFTSPDYQPGYTNPVEITVGNDTWTFGNTSTLTLPGGSRISPLGANLDIFAGTGSYVNLITSDESSSMGVDNSGGYIVTAGGTWDFDTTGNLTVPGNINFGGDASAGPSLNDFASVTSAANFAIVTDSANTDQTWNFDSTGNLTLPDSSVITASAGYVTIGSGDGSGLLVGASGALFNADNSNFVIYGNRSDPGTSITIPSDANAGNGQPLTIENQISNVEITAGGNTWTFDTAGTLTAPGNISATRLQNDANLVLRSNVAGTLRNWTFDTLGDLNLPAGGNIVGSGGISANTGTFTGNVTAANFEGNISITGNITGTSANVDLVAGSYEWSFDNTGNLTLPGNTFAVNYANNTPVDVVTRFEGAWTVPTGNSTQSFTVDGNHSYQMWLEGNIANGIIVWNATVTVTNTNVPVLGQQFAWNYEGGGNVLLLTSIPNQIVGTAGTISNTAPVVTNTNVFSFGINNASGSEQSIRYGWIQIS